jgi:hypothetical protein
VTRRFLTAAAKVAATVALSVAFARWYLRL